jgi:hypothetical protein
VASECINFFSLVILNITSKKLGFRLDLDPPLVVIGSDRIMIDDKFSLWISGKIQTIDPVYSDFLT